MIAVLSSLFAAPVRADTVNVFAAASLRGALDEVLVSWREASGHQTRVSYAGSSALARQVENGAPADVVFLANSDWMARLGAAGVLADEPIDVLSNALVLVAHEPTESFGTLDDPGRLLGLIGDAKLAMGLTEAVPAGIYARAALDTLRIWRALEDQVVEADNVRSALALVARGEAPFGIVYATDAPLEPELTVVGTFPARTHPTILYPAAVTVAGDRPAPRELLTYLTSPDATATFLRHGFTAPP